MSLELTVTFVWKMVEKSAGDIKNEILKNLEEHWLHIQLCFSYEYDNGATMPRVHSSIQTCFKDLNPKALFVL